MKQIRSFKSMSVQAKASVVYTLASLMTKGISIITVPFFTRIMSTDEVGITTTFASWYSILYTIVTLSLSSGSLNVAMIEYKHERDKYQSVCLTLSTVSALIAFVIYLLFPNTISSFTSLSKPLMILMLFSFIIVPATDIWMMRQRYEYSYASVAVLTVVNAFMGSVLALVGVIIAKSHGIAELGTVKLFLQYTVQIAIGVVFYYIIFRRGKTLWNKQMASFALMLSIPLIIHSLAKQILDVSDRLMIASMCGQSDAGIYGTVYNISMLSLIVWNAINASLIPFMFEKLDHNDDDSIKKAINPLLMIYGIVAVLITLMAPEIIMILAPKEYYGAVYIVPAISAGIFMTAVYNIFGNVLLYHKKSTYIMAATIMASLLNVVLNFVFIRKFGYMAAAYTTFVGYIVLAVLQGFMQRIVHQKNVINVKGTVVISVLVMIACLLCNLLYGNNILRYSIILLMSLVIILLRKPIIEKYNKVRNVK